MKQHRRMVKKVKSQKKSCTGRLEGKHSGWKEREVFRKKEEGWKKIDEVTENCKKLIFVICSWERD
jgi:hypothetical protein